MPYLKTTWFGTFLYDDEKIIDKRLFPKEAEKIAERLHKIQKGEVLEEEKEFADYRPVVDETRLKNLGRMGIVKKLEVKGEDYGYDVSLLHEATLLLSRKKIGEQQADRSKRLGEAVEALDDVIKIINILLERLRGWYGYFSFGEVEDGKELIEKIKHLRIGTERVDEMEQENMANMAEILASLYSCREKLEDYVEEVVKKIAPNVAAITGPNIAARLISHAGGIEKLAMYPSGTIQLLGAEKALFRHIKEGTPPPKHGVIFQHEMINKAPRNKRGKIARLMATKISTAAKADAFTGNFIADDLKREMEKRYREIMEEG
ncbi:MAG: ribosomal biogenesis protein [Thermoplasmata archaeon]|nr:ribosomal biogenesis protein [Thermoplasmata archaeon]